MATLNSYVPAGTSSSLLYAVLSPSRVSSVAAQSSAQSAGQPTSLCSEPTRVAVRGASAACAVVARVTGTNPPTTEMATAETAAVKDDRRATTAPECSGSDIWSAHQLVRGESRRRCGCLRQPRPTTSDTSELFRLSADYVRRNPSARVFRKFLQLLATNEHRRVRGRYGMLVLAILP